MYNGGKLLYRCLDSIFSQQLNSDLYEVICIDDCSTDSMSSRLIDSYLYKNRRPSNLYVVHHNENKRRGGACNTGVNLAKGLWIINIDCDDYFLSNSLQTLTRKLQTFHHLDILVYNYCNTNYSRCIDYGETNEMNGDEYIQSKPVPWTSWSYAFKRKLLIENNIKYEEHVYFEDCDYVINAILQAKHIKFVDEVILFYNVYEGQTSTINSARKVEDLFKLTTRLKNKGLALLAENPASGQVVLNHQWYQYCCILKWYLWRLSPRDAYRLLKKYQPYDYERGWLRIFPRIPLLYVILSTLFKPFLLIASKFYRRFIKK